MSEMNPRNTEIQTETSEMSAIAQGIIEAPQTDLNRVRAEFTEDKLVLEQPTDAPTGEAHSVEIRADESETLLAFHEACRERGIVFGITRLSHR
jgi:hypothetical protein